MIALPIRFRRFQVSKIAPYLTRAEVLFLLRIILRIIQNIND